jgi:transcriptional regulator with XRE-family HTH domain
MTATAEAAPVIRVNTDRELGPLLRWLRHRAGLTQTELGRRVHITKSAVSNRETDSRAMTAGALIETADALGYDLVLVARNREGVQP